MIMTSRKCFKYRMFLFSGKYVVFIQNQINEVHEHAQTLQCIHIGLTPIRYQDDGCSSHPTSNRYLPWAHFKILLIINVLLVPCINYAISNIMVATVLLLNNLACGMVQTSPVCACVERVHHILQGDQLRVGKRYTLQGDLV